MLFTDQVFAYLQGGFKPNWVCINLELFHSFGLWVLLISLFWHMGSFHFAFLCLVDVHLVELFHSFRLWVLLICLFS